MTADSSLPKSNLPDVDPVEVSSITEMLHTSWKSKRDHLVKPDKLVVAIQYTYGGFRTALVVSVLGRSTMLNKAGEPCGLPCSLDILTYDIQKGLDVGDARLANLMTAAITVAAHYGWLLVPALSVGNY